MNEVEKLIDGGDGWEVELLEIFDRVDVVVRGREIRPTPVVE